MIYLLKGNGTRTSKTLFPSFWHPNTQIQIHKYTNTQIYKYTNTVWVKLSDRPNMWYIFQNAMIRGPQKQCSQVSDIQIHTYKYTNTQIQFGSNLKIWRFEDLRYAWHIFVTGTLLQLLQFLREMEETVCGTNQSSTDEEGKIKIFLSLNCYWVSDKFAANVKFH